MADEVKEPAAAAPGNAPIKAPERPIAPITNPTHENHIWARRSFFGLAGWGLLSGTLGVWGTAFLRMLFPRVLFEPPSSFKAGFKGDFTVGVSEKYTTQQRVWIVKEQEQMFALIAICTHLGCTPRWLSLEQKFKCPCHGSGFKANGVNFEGPAPRPLERAKISIADDGQILIDKSVQFRWEKGDWGKPGSFLPV
jgi:cytochrome b6-f complex iron-sulfur subunit